MNVQHRVLRTAIPMICIFLMGVLSSHSSHAMPASPHASLEQQPDGSVVELHIRGDEHYSWTEDPDGYVVLRRHKWYR